MCLASYKKVITTLLEQERHASTKEEAESWKVQWGGKLFYSLGTSHSLGQIVLISKKLMHNADIVDRNDRIIITDIIS